MTNEELVAQLQRTKDSTEHLDIFVPTLRDLLVQDISSTLESIAQTIEVSPKLLAQRLRLLQLHPQILSAVAKGDVPFANGYMLCMLPEQEQLPYMTAAIQMHPGYEFRDMITMKLKELKIKKAVNIAFHLRCDTWTEKHAYITVFCNSANTGRLVMDHDDAISLKTALEYFANNIKCCGDVTLDVVKISGHWPGEQAT